MALSDENEMVLLCLVVVVPLFVLWARASARLSNTEREFIRSKNAVLGGCAIAMIVVESICLALSIVFFSFGMNGR